MPADICEISGLRLLQSKVNIVVAICSFGVILAARSPPLYFQRTTYLSTWHQMSRILTVTRYARRCRDIGVRTMRLMTNNPAKFQGLRVSDRFNELITYWCSLSAFFSEHYSSRLALAQCFASAERTGRKRGFAYQAV